MELKPYYHKVHYYETDKMAITHHSNYVRWMEEARVDFLDQIGWSFAKLEAGGVLSPVVAVDCRYKEPTRFHQDIAVRVTVQEFKGVRLVLAYEMTDAATGHVVCTATSEHCFTDTDGRIVILRKVCPELHRLLTEME